MRTRYSFYNFIVSLVTSVLLPIFGFVKYRLFIDLYGSDVNGLQLTIIGVITFLNICELAYSLAFRQLLFQPLAEGNRQKVLNIYHGARKVFVMTGWAVLIIGTIVAFCFPNFSQSPFSYGQTVGTFILLLLPYALSYFLMGPNFVIIADQQEYKINIWIQSIAILRMVFIVVGIMMNMPFIFVLIIEGINVLGSNIIARHIALKQYPWLKEPATEKDDSFVKNAPYTIIQRLSTLATNNTDNIVIASFMGYGMVSIYGTYSYLNEAVTKIVQSAITSPINSFGNLFNDKKADSYKVFTEFFNFACYIASIASICIFVIMNRFVHLWVAGREGYEVSIGVAFLFAVNIFYLTMREPIIISRDANGLFKDAKNNAYLLAISKVILSVALIKFFGIAGVLMATLLTNWLVDFTYNPKLVYTKVFELPVSRYFKMVFLRVAIALGVGLLGYSLWTYALTFNANGWIGFILACMVLGCTVLGVITIVYWFAFESFRNLVFRFLNILKRKKSNA